VVLEARITLGRGLRLLQRHGLRSVDRLRDPARLRNHKIPLLQLVPDELEIDADGRWALQRDLEAAAECLGYEAGGITAVGRVRRAVEARWDDHRASVRWMTPKGGRASV
jgi:hypothetical protein